MALGFFNLIDQICDKYDRRYNDHNQHSDCYYTNWIHGHLSGRSIYRASGRWCLRIFDFDPGFDGPDHRCPTCLRQAGRDLHYASPACLGIALAGSSASIFAISHKFIDDLALAFNMRFAFGNVPFDLGKVICEHLAVHVR
jgi:hypothetical protein